MAIRRSSITQPYTDDQASSDRWLVSYSDLLTLMMAFFVVMYSIEQMNDEKAAAVVQKISVSFAHAESHVKAPSTTVIDLGGTAGDSSPGDNVSKQDKESTLERLGDTIQQAFSGDNTLEIRGNEEWLEIAFDAAMLFQPSSASLQADAVMMLKQISNILSQHRMPIRIEGFTDGEILTDTHFASNWELSSARASSVAKYLADNGVDPSMLAAIGYADYQPVAEGDSAKNRRVVLLIGSSESVRPKRQMSETKLFEGVDTSAKGFVKGFNREASEREAQARALATQQALDRGEPELVLPPGLPEETEEEAPPPEPTFNTIQLDNGGLLFTNDSAEQRTQ
jgi:chemotaxis protein MotB